MPTRAMGHTFEFTFPLPEPSNAGGRPARTKKTSKTSRKRFASKSLRKAAPKARKPKRHHELTPAELETKRQEYLEYDRLRHKTPEYMEYSRLKGQERRRNAKELGLCRDCMMTAIPGQARCQTCAEKNRQSQRRAQERVSQKREQAPGQTSMF